ncbi:MAG: tetratricopeptide (TPR) repeat protein [Candidatus Omnitrophota bacterium]|jgi:tetratricopeptide (TPR) repeat protein
MSSWFQRIVVSPTLILTFFLVVLSATDSNAARSVTNSTKLNEGILAGSAGDWSSAKDYFLEINADNAGHPQALYNLGLSNAKLGRELLSLAWFISYVQSYPETIHRNQLLSAIDELFLDSQQHIRDLLIQAENSADGLGGGQARIEAYSTLAKVYAGMGWFAESESFWRRYHRYVPKGNADNHDIMLKDYSMNLILAGSYEIADERISEITNRQIKKELKVILEKYYQPRPLAWLMGLFNRKPYPRQISSEELVQQARADMNNAYISNTAAVLEALKMLPPKEFPTKLTEIAQAHILAITYWQRAHSQLILE